MKKTTKVLLLIGGCVTSFSTIVYLFILAKSAFPILIIGIIFSAFSPEENPYLYVTDFFIAFIRIGLTFRTVVAILFAFSLISVGFSIVSSVFAFIASEKEKISFYITNIVLSIILLLINLILFNNLTIFGFGFFFPPIFFVISFLPITLVGSIIGLVILIKEKNQSHRPIVFPAP